MPLTLLREAVTVAVPAATLLSSPFRFMIATETSDELQVTWPVIFSTEPSLNVPVAAYC